MFTSTTIMLCFTVMFWPFPKQQRQELTFNICSESPSSRLHLKKSTFFSPCLWVNQIRFDWFSIDLANIPAAGGGFANFHPQSDFI